jgi:hypothetical protein
MISTVVVVCTLEFQYPALGKTLFLEKKIATVYLKQKWAHCPQVG